MLQQGLSAAINMVIWCSLVPAMPGVTSHDPEREIDLLSLLCPAYAHTETRTILQHYTFAVPCGSFPFAAVSALVKALLIFMFAYGGW